MIFLAGNWKGEIWKNVRAYPSLEDFIVLSDVLISYYVPFDNAIGCVPIALIFFFIQPKAFVMQHLEGKYSIDPTPPSWNLAVYVSHI